MALSSLSVVSDANRLRRFRAQPLAEDAERPAVEPGVEIGAAAPEQAVDPVCGMEVDPASAATTDSANGDHLLLLLDRVSEPLPGGRAAARLRAPKQR